MARVGPDGGWLIYKILSNAKFPNQSDSFRLMRVPMAGGAPRPIFETKAKDTNFDCVLRSGAECVISERSPDIGQFISQSFDPVNGTRHPLFKIAMPGQLSWTVSPDGSRLAMTGTDPQGGIEIRSLTGRIESTIEAKGWPKPRNVDWAADGKAPFVLHFGLIGSPSGPIGATLLRVDLQGNVQTLWETRGGRYTCAIASRDGRYVAICGPASERNAWIIENF